MKVIEIDKCEFCPYLLPPDIREPTLIDLNWGTKALGQRWDDDENLDERERPHMCQLPGGVNEISLADLNELEDTKKYFLDGCPLPDATDKEM